ncbi:hypothetical protein Sru01_14620 [Sphaerisporangium rufum]|uniref:Uncharacterized protein n=2 Tax=Sphaerisporangium rufum TaxID=1381558 RepID=A0A919R147_9ACTN|nr:hypothetical protein Sru01_14620 [Sphaerisporangium rufum]
MGKVVAKLTEENSWDGVTSYSEVLVMDVGSKDPSESLKKATVGLQKNGWKVERARPPETIFLRSKSSEHVTLMMYGIEFFEAERGSDPTLKRLVQEGQREAAPNSPVVIRMENEDAS